MRPLQGIKCSRSFKGWVGGGGAPVSLRLYAQHLRRACSESAGVASGECEFG